MTPLNGATGRGKFAHIGPMRAFLAAIYGMDKTPRLQHTSDRLLGFKAAKKR